MDNTILLKINSFLYCLTYFIYGSIQSGLGPLIVLKAQDMQINETDFGIAFTLKGFGGLLAAITTPYIQRYLSWQKLIALSFITLELANLGNMISQNLWIICCLFFAGGFGASVGFIITSTSIVKMHIKMNAQLWTKALHFSFGMGAFISPLLITLFKYNAYAFYSIVGLAVSLPFLFLPYPESQITLNKPNTDESLDEKKSESKLQPMPSSMNKLMLLFFFCYTGTQLIFYNWISTFGVMLQISTTQVFYAPSIFWITMTAVRGLSLPISYYFNTVQQLPIHLISMLSSLVLGVLLLVLGWKLGFLYGISFLLGLSLSCIFPLIMTVPNYFGFEMTTENTSKYDLGSSIGEMIIQFIVGFGMKNIDKHFFVFTIILFGLIITLIYKNIYDIGVAITQQKQMEMKGPQFNQNQLVQ